MAARTRGLARLPGRKLLDMRTYDRSADAAAMDLRRANDVFGRIAADTAGVIDRLNAGLMNDANFRMVEARVAEDHFQKVFAEVRFEAYADAADLARAFAGRCEAAAADAGEAHLAATLNAIAQMFRTYAERLDQKARTSLDATAAR